jgi:hypothetical protein
MVGERVDLVRHEGRGPDPERQNGPHAHFVHVDPAGPVTIVDLGLDRLLHMRFADGRLTPAGETAAPAGAGPRHLVAHPNGYWYVSAELDPAVLSFAVDPQTGWLRNTAIGAATTCPPERPNLPSGIALSPDNRFLYVSNRGPNTISTFQVEEDGTLRAVGEVGTGGDWPRQFAIVGDLLFVANQRSHRVVTFRLDPVSGLPEPTGDQLDVPSPSCVLVSPGDLRPNLDAVFVASDVMATGALYALRRAGRQVPGDVAVVGFDDLILATQTRPKLTTMRQPRRGLRGGGCPDPAGQPGRRGAATGRGDHAADPAGDPRVRLSAARRVSRPPGSHLSRRG